MLVYDPSVKKEYKDRYIEGNGFSFRYLSGTMRFGRAMYLPYGPNIVNLEGIDNFFELLNSYKFKKVKIDLPYIWDIKVKELIISNFNAQNYNVVPYTIDNQTIIVDHNNYSISKRDLQYCNSEKASRFRYYIGQIPNVIIPAVYEIYKESSLRLKYIPKSIDIFYKLSNVENNIVVYDGDIPISFILTDESMLENLDKSKSQKFIYHLLTGANNIAFENKVGYKMHKLWIENALSKDYKVDLHGAGANKSYTEFKKKFVYNNVEISLYNLSGSFKKIILF